MTQPIGTRRTLLLSLAAVIWLLTIGLGYRKVMAYSLTPGTPAAPPRTWPSSVRFERNTTGATVVMLVHPRCPCTRASIAQLSEVMTRFPSARGYMFFLRPEGFSRDWTQTDIWKSAQHIPRMATIIDDEGADAAWFGARTSGQVLVYDRSGRLAFSGGITAGRGHLGENVGEARMIALLSGAKTDRSDSAVFGCSLLDPHGLASKESRQ